MVFPFNKQVGFIAAAALLFSGESTLKAQNTQKMNILFISVDDLRYQAGTFGQEEMITPHIDQLAADGVAFTRAYCNVPVCGASRASVLSGVRPTRTRFVTFNSRKDVDYPEGPSLPAWLRTNDYRTISYGKVYHHINDDFVAWSELPWRPQAGLGWQAYITEESHQIIEENRDPANPNVVKGPPYEMADVDDYAYPDGMLARRSVEKLESMAELDQPFFMAVGFFKPHLPFNAPKKYWDLYEADEIMLADNPDRPQDAPNAAMHNWGELRNGYAGIPQSGPVSEELERKLVHGYYACVSYIDAQIGKLLQALDDFGLAENTIVAFWGDHGFHLGEHGLWAKHCNFDRVLTAPLIIKVPGNTQENHATTLVEFIDIYPTMVELVGLPLPDHLDGKSLVPILNNPELDHKDAVFSRWQNGESVKTDRYLYTEWMNAERQAYARMLYDHHNDPKENINLSNRSEYAEIVEYHSMLIHDLLDDLVTDTDYPVMEKGLGPLIYPNPVREVLKLTGVENLIQAMIIANDGRIAGQYRFPTGYANNEISVSWLPPGMYTLQLSDYHGEVFHLRFLKLNQNQ